MYHFGLIGYPLGHSLSPQLHGAALQEVGLEGDYQLFPVQPLPEGSRRLDGLLDELRNGELSGLNVTIPHKQTVLPWLDELTPVAKAVGAVNCIYCRQSRLVGDNTDAPGFIIDLQRILSSGKDIEKYYEDWSSQTIDHALILGAGGSARAVAFALDQEGWEITIAARRTEQAAELVKSLALSGSFEPVIAVVRLDSPSIKNIVSKIRLVINTTPVGMIPNLNASPWPEGLAFPSGALIYDLIYNPPETAFIKAASCAGLSIANGSGMLVEQAALSFELWTGLIAPREAMRRAIPGMGENR